MSAEIWDLTLWLIFKGRVVRKVWGRAIWLGRKEAGAAGGKTGVTMGKNGQISLDLVKDWMPVGKGEEVVSGWSP